MSAIIAIVGSVLFGLAVAAFVCGLLIAAVALAGYVSHQDLRHWLEVGE